MASIKIFGLSDQELFASLSGDANPIHLDPLAARRTLAGAPVVHGVHAVLWALNELASGGNLTGKIAAISARFQKFIYVDAEVRLEVSVASDKSLRVRILSDDIVTTVIDIAYGDEEPPPDMPAPSASVDILRPAEMDISNLAGRSGHLQSAPATSIAQTFPHAARVLGNERLATIALMSKLVGMVCPGLHSIFSAFAIRIISAAHPELNFRVEKVDERFPMIDIAVWGGGIAGEVTAFLRHPPIQQASIDKIRSRVNPAEFSGVRALIIGGSRGLGALTAKIISAGGGRVTITYASGESDAQAIAEEIGNDSVSILRYDVRDGAARQLGTFPIDINELYYFATPHIFRQGGAQHSANRLATFCVFYVDGLRNLCSALRARYDHGFAVFYPSSTAIDENPRDMNEYITAKIAGETLCAEMNRDAQGIRVIVKRLPRVLTDQTATVMPVAHEDALETMLPIVRKMPSL